MQVDLLQRKKLVGFLLLTVVLIGIGMALSGPATAGLSESNAECLELEAVLGEIRRTWKPGEKSKVFQKAAAKIEVLRAPLLGLLSEASHPLLREAVQLAAAWDLKAAHPAILSLATGGAEEVRPAAILAAERLRPFDLDVLRGLLEEGGHPVVLVAALEVSSLRGERPFPEIFRLLGHPDPRVRNAAGKAVPHELVPAVLEQLLDAARNTIQYDDPLAGVHAIHVLGRTQPHPKVEAFLVEQLDEHGPAAFKVAALAVLPLQGSRLRRPVAVWKLIADTSEDPAVRAQALLCVERTRAFTPEQIRAQLPYMDPATRYVAARCLLTAGQKDGIDILLELEAQRRRDGFRELDKELAKALGVAVAQLVRRLRGREPADDMHRLWEWSNDLRKLPAQRLPPPRFLTPAAPR